MRILVVKTTEDFLYERQCGFTWVSCSSITRPSRNETIDVKKKDQASLSGELCDKNRWNCEPVRLFLIHPHSRVPTERREQKYKHYRRLCREIVDSERGCRPGPTRVWKVLDWFESAFGNITKMFLVQSVILSVFLTSLAASANFDVELQLLHVVKKF